MPGHATQTALNATQLESGMGFAGNYFMDSGADGITAHAGGTKALAFPIVTQIARVSVCATVGDSVLLPPAQQGLDVMLIHSGAKAMQVFGQGTDTVNDIAAATGVSQMPNSMVIYVCPSDGKWYAQDIGTGYAGSLPTQSSSDNMTAHAGGTQALGTPIFTTIARFTVVASGGDSALLPPSAAGMEITVINNTAATSMNVFPATGEAINALGANAAFAVAGAKTVTFYCATAGQWHTILSA